MGRYHSDIFSNPRKKTKTHGNVIKNSLGIKKKKKKEIHHVLEKRYRNRHIKTIEFCERYETKEVDPLEHDIWHSIANGNHPNAVFKWIIKICASKIHANKKEKQNIDQLAGFNCQKYPKEAIITIFDKFMPSGSYKILENYLKETNI